MSSIQMRQASDVQVPTVYYNLQHITPSHRHEQLNPSGLYLFYTLSILFIIHQFEGGKHTDIYTVIGISSRYTEIRTIPYLALVNFIYKLKHNS